MSRLLSLALAALIVSRDAEMSWSPLGAQVLAEIKKLLVRYLNGVAAEGCRAPN